MTGFELTPVGTALSQAGKLVEFLKTKYTDTQSQRLLLAFEKANFEIYKESHKLFVENAELKSEHVRAMADMVKTKDREISEMNQALLNVRRELNEAQKANSSENAKGFMAAPIIISEGNPSIFRGGGTTA
jgi:hypothetical protein